MAFCAGHLTRRHRLASLPTREYRRKPKCLSAFSLLTPLTRSLTVTRARVDRRRASKALERCNRKCDSRREQGHVVQQNCSSKLEAIGNPFALVNVIPDVSSTTCVVSKSVQLAVAAPSAGITGPTEPARSIRSPKKTRQFPYDSMLASGSRGNNIRLYRLSVLWNTALRQIHSLSGWRADPIGPTISGQLGPLGPS